MLFRSKDLKTEISRQLSWNGRGDLALISTAPVASTAVVISGRTTGEPALKYIDVNSTFDIITSAGAVNASGVTVSSISSGTASSATATLVLDQPVTAAVGDILIRSGSQGNEIQGLFYALDGATSTVYSVDRSANLAYQGNEIGRAHV